MCKARRDDNTILLSVQRKNDEKTCRLFLEIIGEVVGSLFTSRNRKSITGFADAAEKINVTAAPPRVDRDILPRRYVPMNRWRYRRQILTIRLRS